VASVAALIRALEDIRQASFDHADARAMARAALAKCRRTE